MREIYNMHYFSAGSQSGFYSFASWFISLTGKVNVVTVASW